MQPNSGTLSLMNVIPLVLVFGVFYFLVIKPQQKKEQEHKKLIGELKKNDEVITAGGIHGVIVGVKDTTFTLRIDDTNGTKVEIEKSSVSQFTKKNS